MPSHRGSPPRSAPVAFVLVAYALILLGGPFLHSEHVRFDGPATDCVTCQASQSVPVVEDPAPPVVRDLTESGRLSYPKPAPLDVLLTARITGRSPPA